MLETLLTVSKYTSRLHLPLSILIWDSPASLVVHLDISVFLETYSLLHTIARLGQFYQGYLMLLRRPILIFHRVRLLLRLPVRGEARSQGSGSVANGRNLVLPTVSVPASALQDILRLHRACLRADSTCARHSHLPSGASSGHPSTHV